MRSSPATERDVAPSTGAGRAEVRALLEVQGLPTRPCAVGYLSFADPASCLASYDVDGQLTPLVGFLPLPLRGDRLLAGVAAIDENGPRLVANYRHAFPGDTERLVDFDATREAGLEESAAPGWLLAACSLALDLEEADVAAALQPVETVGLDTFVIEVDGGYVLDGRRFLRSAMSYRIGGVPKQVIGRSMLESLGQFVSDGLGRLLRVWSAEAIVLAGDLFEGDTPLAWRARRNLASWSLPIVPAGTGACQPQEPQSSAGAPVRVTLRRAGAAVNPGGG